MIEIGVLAGLRLVGVRGVGEPEIVGRTEPQLGIDAGVAARLDERFLRLLVLVVDELADARVVLRAGVAMLGGRARGGDGEQGEPLHRGASRRRSAPAPIHSDASNATSANSTNHG